MRGSERCLQASEEGEQQGEWDHPPQQAALPVLGEVREEEEQEEGRAGGIRIPGSCRHPIFQLGALACSLSILPEPV